MKTAPQTAHTPKLERAEKWTGRYRDVSFQISLHGVGENYCMDGAGTWCFYVYIAEDKAANFPALWLEDTIYRWKPEALGRITHDYGAATNGMEFHGGCTFYKKHGHTDGYRYVEFGCDYAHIWDHEHGPYMLEDILRDAQRCIDSLYDSRVLKPEATQP